MRKSDNLHNRQKAVLSVGGLRQEMRRLLGDDDSIEAQVRAYNRLFEDYRPTEPMRAYKLVFEDYNLEKRIEAYQILLKDYDVEQRIEACEILLEDFDPEERIEACEALFKDYESLVHLHPKDETPARAKKILVVNDDADMLATIETILEQGGYNVITAPDGSKGIRVLEEELPDLVISDVVMSGVGGYEFYKLIEHKLKSLGIPFILSAERGDKENLWSGMAPDLDGYISKPLDAEELLATVKAVLERAEILRRSSEEGEGESADRHSIAKKVLVVDDHPPIRRAIRALLEKEDYQVIEASDGVEAVIKTLQYRPDLIFMDIVMPVMDGLTACARIKSISSIEKIPIIVLTAKRQREDVVNTARAGAVDFIVKPFSPRMLIDKVKRHIGRAELGIEVIITSP